MASSPSPECCVSDSTDVRVQRFNSQPSMSAAKSEWKGEVVKAPPRMDMSTVVVMAMRKHLNKGSYFILALGVYH